jgi:hypothetical protein
MSRFDLRAMILRPIPFNAPLLQPYFNLTSTSLLFSTHLDNIHPRITLDYFDLHSGSFSFSTGHTLLSTLAGLP